MEYLGTHRLRENSAAVNGKFYSGTVSYNFIWADGSKHFGAETDNTTRFDPGIPDFHYFEDYVHQIDRSVKRYPAGPATHLSVKIPPLPMLVPFSTYDGGLFTFTDVAYMPFATYQMQRFIGQLGWGFATDSVPTSTEISDLSLEAFNYFGEVFPREVSASEFTQGFFQMKSLLPEIKDSLLKTLSGGFLTKKFGWDNLTADLSALTGVIDECRQRLEYLKKTYGIPTRLGFHRANIHELPHGYEWYTSYEPCLTSGRYGARLRLLDYTCEFRATAWLTQTLDFLDGPMGWLRALSGTFGLDNPVKLIWEVIPFSFLIDWFTNVSNHLDALTKARPAVGWDLYQVTHSITVKSKWSLSQAVDVTHPSDRDVSTIQLERTSYIRDLGVPYDWGLLDPSQLSRNQQILLFALIGANG